MSLLGKDDRYTSNGVSRVRSATCRGLSLSQLKAQEDELDKLQVQDHLAMVAGSLISTGPACTAAVPPGDTILGGGTGKPSLLGGGPSAQPPHGGDGPARDDIASISKRPRIEAGPFEDQQQAEEHRIKCAIRECLNDPDFPGE